MIFLNLRVNSSLKIRENLSSTLPTWQFKLSPINKSMLEQLIWYLNSSPKEKKMIKK